MGHTDRERRRLSVQAGIVNPLTESFLRRAGISAGMRVLELGCGVGEVSLIAARLVGPHGHVHCIDIDEAALEIVRERARSAGHDHVVVEKTDVAHFYAEQPFDAVIGRLILIHTNDAVAILQKAVDLVHPGGVIAFQDTDFTHVPRAYPEMPLTFRTMELVRQFAVCAVPRPDIGLQLPRLMQDVGLPPPECRCDCVMDGGPYSPVYEWIAETVRTVLPGIVKFGFATAEEVDIDTLEQRLRQEAAETKAFVLAWPLVDAFARKPFR